LSSQVDVYVYQKVKEGLLGRDGEVDLSGRATYNALIADMCFLEKSFADTRNVSAQILSKRLTKLIMDIGEDFSEHGMTHLDDITRIQQVEIS